MQSNTEVVDAEVVDAEVADVEVADMICHETLDDIPKIPKTQTSKRRIDDEPMLKETVSYKSLLWQAQPVNIMLVLIERGAQKIRYYSLDQLFPLPEVSIDVKNALLYHLFIMMHDLRSEQPKWIVDSKLMLMSIRLMRWYVEKSNMVNLSLSFDTLFLVMTACMWITTKLHEDIPLRAKQIIERVNSNHDMMRAVIKLELDICTVLQWKLLIDNECMDNDICFDVGFMNKKEN